MTKILNHLIFALAVMLVATSCQKRAAQVPTQFEACDLTADIYPDYKNITVPPNIAPLNFMLVDSMASEAVVQMKGQGTELLAAADANGTFRLDSCQWRRLLTGNKGRDIEVSLYARHDGSWLRYRQYKISVAEEDIDAFLSYRLIEPGYELYRQLGLYQRNLTNWDVHTIYENNREYNDNENHCVNCHNFHGNDASKFLFHVRSNHGGTVIVDNGKAHKVQIKDSTIITAGVYPSWHPNGRLVAFSTNKTGQVFHLFHQEKVEVIDESSDLLLYDAESNEVSHILRSSYDLETFPCWSPSGDRLYYCNANVEQILDKTAPDSTRGMQLSYSYDKIKYNLMSIPFDVKTKKFGTPQLEVDAAAVGKSITLPRVSPDGRYVLYGIGKYGQFHIWHKTSDLWVKDLVADTCYALKEANSHDVDSYHSWSGNGRWIAFSSRRMDGNYTRTFIAYFDKQGKAHKAFVIPQEDPEFNKLLLKSYNVPELTRNRISVPTSELRRCIYETEGENAKYIKQ